MIPWQRCKQEWNVSDETSLKTTTEGKGISEIWHFKGVAETLPFYFFLCYSKIIPSTLKSFGQLVHNSET